MVVDQRRVVRLGDLEISSVGELPPIREIPYDSLILATGSRHFYFGHERWGQVAPGLKTLEDAQEIRRRILSAFEAGEQESSSEAVRPASNWPARWARLRTTRCGASSARFARRRRASS